MTALLSLLKFSSYNDRFKGSRPYLCNSPADSFRTGNGIATRSNAPVGNVGTMIIRSCNGTKDCQVSSTCASDGNSCIAGRGDVSNAVS